MLENLLTNKTKKLNTSEIATFLYIMNEIIDNGVLTKSNKDIAEDLNKSVSTIEKHLKKLDSIGLITRERIKAHNNYTLRWETVSRSIMIPDSIVSHKLLAEMKTQRVKQLLKLVITPESTVEMIKSFKESRQVQ